MELNLQNVFKIKQKRHDTIFGYIREASLIKNIPKEIILICVLFYGQEMEYFQHYTKGQWSVTNNGKTIIKSKNGAHTIYASNVIKCDTNMVYKWTVKINKLNKYGYYCGMAVMNPKWTYL